MSNDNSKTNTPPTIKRIPKKVFFVRINEDIYKEIGGIADENERSINWTVNNLLKQSLAEKRSR